MHDIPESRDHEAQEGRLVFLFGDLGWIWLGAQSPYFTMRFIILCSCSYGHWKMEQIRIAAFPFS